MSDDERVADLERQVAAMQSELARIRGTGSLDSAAFGHDWQHQLSGLFGGGAGTSASSVAALADPPRRVPLSLRLTVLTWSWYEAFTVVILFTAPIAVWALAPPSVPAGFIAALLVIGGVRARRHGRRQALLRWGKVADVTGSEVVSSGTYYSGVTYNNMIVPQAHGWEVERRFYSGPATTTDIAYTLDGTPAVLRMRGLRYVGGVVLADSRRPTVALCVSQFPYDVRPGSDGQLDGALKLRTWVGIVAEAVLLAGLVAGAVVSVQHIWLGTGG